LNRRTDICQNKVTYIKLVKFGKANNSVHVNAFSSLETLSYTRKTDSTFWGLTNPPTKGLKRCLWKIVSTIYHPRRRNNFTAREGTTT